MQLRWTGTEVLLEAPDDLQSFRVVVAGTRLGATEAAQAFHGIARFADEQTAWVDEKALREWPGCASSPAWQEGLDSMIMKARPYGWVDDIARAIRAHVVYELEIAS